MKSPKVKGIGEVVTEYGAKVMKIFKKGLLGRSLFDFYGDVKAQTFRTKESASSPSTPTDGAGGIMYTKSADGKLYYKSNEVSEVEISSSGATLTTEEVQDIVGAMVDGGTETNIAVTYDDSGGKLNFVSTDTNTTYSEATSSDAGLMSTAHHDKLDGIETGATADQTQADINGLAITTVGTISSGTWQGTAIASAYLDSDTAHLSGAQSFTGQKTFDAGIILDGNRSVAASGDGVAMHLDAMDITNATTSASGTASLYNHVVLENPRVLALNSSVTTTDASTLYIKGAPVASTNQTITNAYALNVAGGNSKFGGNISSTGTITGKMKQMFHLSFHDDLGTTKHWMPWGGTLEQSGNAYQEEVAMSMPYGGRIVSCLVRTQAINSSGTLTIGIETKEPGALVGSSWTSEETENLSVGSTDANHAFHFVFDNASHFEPGDLVAMSIQSNSDLSNSTYWYVTTVVEFDLNDPLGTTSAEYDSNP